jgi:hypothetical protein
LGVRVIISLWTANSAFAVPEPFLFKSILILTSMQEVKIAHNNKVEIVLRKRLSM